MAILENSRYLIDSVLVEVVDPATGKRTRPAFIDIRPRVTAFARDDRAIIPDDSQQWSHLGVQYLKDANAWWVIADMSGVVDPFEELENSNELGQKPRRFRCPSVGRYYLNILSGERAVAGRKESW